MLEPVAEHGLDGELVLRLGFNDVGYESVDGAEAIVRGALFVRGHDGLDALLVSLKALLQLLEREEPRLLRREPVPGGRKAGFPRFLFCKRLLKPGNDLCAL